MEAEKPGEPIHAGSLLDEVRERLLHDFENLKGSVFDEDILERIVDKVIFELRTNGVIDYAALYPRNRPKNEL